MDSQEERNYCCLILLVSRVGNPCLHRYFKNQWDAAGTYTPWTDCAQNGTDLLRIFKPLPYERNKVKSGDTSQWDISLLINALLHSRPPFVVATNLVAALKKLREMRNELCHSPNSRVEPTDFQTSWRDGCNALSLFGATAGDFDKVEQDVQKPWSELLPMLKHCADQDEAILDTLDSFNSKLEQLQQGQDNFAEGQDKLLQGQDTIINILESHKKVQVWSQGQQGQKRSSADVQPGEDAKTKKQRTTSDNRERDHAEDEKPSSWDRAEAGPSHIDEEPSGEAVQSKTPRTASEDGERDHAEDSEMLKKAIKANTENQTKIMAAHDVTGAKTDEIFTNLTVYYEDEKQEKKEQAKDLGRSEKLQEYTKRTMSCKVEKYEDIFIDMKGENPKLLLTGKPGIGKTMFCEKVIRDWSMNRLFQNENTPNIQFAYLLKFSHLDGDKEMNLHELLNCSHLLDDNSKITDSLFEYLIQNSSKVLIILDGFDECSEEHRKQISGDYEGKYSNNSKAKMPIPALCSKLMRGKVLGNSVVLVSSRPGKAEELGKINFDRYVEISGFSPEQVTEYVDKYFSEPEKEQTKKAVREHIEKNENLISFCHIPLLSFLLCWCLEWRISRKGITENLPAKITDLYDEVVKVLVQKLHANLKYSKMLEEDAKKIAEETLDELAKLGANLLKESKYIFDEEDMKKLGLNQDDIENLKVSGILHCVPGIAPFETKAEFSFTHLTLQEYFSASFFVKHKEIPEKENVSGQTLVFMCGLLSKERDGKQLMSKLIQQVTPKDYGDDVNKLLMLQCLYEYGEEELTKQTINNLYDKYCDSGTIGFKETDDADVKYISYLLDIIRSLKEQHIVIVYALKISRSPLTSFGVGVVCRSLVRNSFITKLELSSCSLDDKCVEKITESLVNTGITHLNLRWNNITDEGVKSICSVLSQTKIVHLDLGRNEITDEGTESICSVLTQSKITKLHLNRNNITDEGAESICSVIIQDDCHVEKLFLFDNKKITEECKKRVEKLLRKHKPGVLAYFGQVKQWRKVGAREKEESRREEEKQDTESISQYHHSLAESAAGSKMKTLTISNKQNQAIIEVTQKGGRFDTSKYGALLEFPPNTVESSTQVVCKVCSRESILSPEADPMETLVSHVVQLGPSVELQQPVIVTMLHAGPGKKSGYETIVKAFNDEERIWKEIEEFKDTSHIPKNYKPGNVIQVKISKLTSLAVISRLVTDTFKVTPTGCVVTSSVCNDVTVTFPEGAVDKTITGSMKVVLLPEMIFLFSGFKDIEFLKPVTIKFPHGGSTDDFPGRLRVMSQKGAVQPGKRWNEVKGNVKLEKKEEGFLELHVQHFCRLTVSNSDGPDPEWNRSPQQVFLGAFKDNNDPLKLTIACASIFVGFEHELKGLGYKRLAVSTAAEMRPEDKAYVQLEDGLDIQAETENVFVKFIEGGSYRKELVYSINEQIHTTSNILYLCFYPTMEYIEDKRIDRLAIDRRRLYPTVENMDIDPPEEGMDIDHEPPMDENQNRFVAPTRLDCHIPANYRPECIKTVYRMTSNPRGIAYIININRFSINPFHKMYGRLVEFLGSDLDVNSLRRLFSDLHFEVQYSSDLNQKDLEDTLKSISQADFSLYDCLIVFIMSHGKENYIYASDGEDVRLKDIFDMFKHSKCPTLQGKPKLFFIHACRGVAANSGEVNRDHSEEQAKIDWPGLNDKRHPEYCDNLYGYSCYEGQLSYGWPDQGSVYVQCLVAVFKEHSCKEPLLNLLTMVNNRVSELEGNQIPCTNYTLRKLLYFYPGLFENP